MSTNVYFDKACKSYSLQQIYSSVIFGSLWPVNERLLEGRQACIFMCDSKILLGEK